MKKLEILFLRLNELWNLNEIFILQSSFRTIEQHCISLSYYLWKCNRYVYIGSNSENKLGVLFQKFLLKTVNNKKDVDMKRAWQQGKWVKTFVSMIGRFMLRYPNAIE